MHDNRLEPLYQAAERLALPSQVLGASRLEITGRRQLLLCGHKGIRVYGQREMVIDLKECALRIQGRELGIQAMTKAELLLGGALDSVSFLP